jgi:hypothetical protein
MAPQLDNDGGRLGSINVGALDRQRRPVRPWIDDDGSGCVVVAEQTNVHVPAGRRSIVKVLLRPRRRTAVSCPRPMGRCGSSVGRSAVDLTARPGVVEAEVARWNQQSRMGRRWRGEHRERQREVTGAKGLRKRRR